MAFRLGMTVYLGMAYLFMLVSINLTLMSGSAKAHKSALNYLDNSASNKH